ncbi:MAG: hypothetical protein COA58_11150 [Bacteroidetes bacterium]|nr:MAG: hypothetical protein COA58_11150 [Bacteroidota bacterium]
MTYLSKNTLFVLITLTSFIIACDLNPATEENTNEEATTEATQVAEDDLITGYGFITYVSDVPYPMHTLTMEFSERKMMQTFNFNITELEPAIEDLSKLNNRYATIKYTSDLEPKIQNVILNGESILGEEEIPEQEDNWESITGTMSGAEQTTSGDLPVSVKITQDNGSSHTFQYFVSPQMTAGNRKEVTIWYVNQPVHTIKMLVLSDEPPQEKNEETEAPLETPTEEDLYDQFMVTESFLILQASKDYTSALKTAKEAAIMMSNKLDLRGYIYEPQEGLTDTTICGCGETHDYIPRGRYDGGDYVSIEHTDSYEEFTNGYYIVVAGSGERNSLRPLLAKAQIHYPDAYLKDAQVYVGCMH